MKIFTEEFCDKLECKLEKISPYVARNSLSGLREESEKL